MIEVSALVVSHHCPSIRRSVHRARVWFALLACVAQRLNCTGARPEAKAANAGKAVIGIRTKKKKSDKTRAYAVRSKPIPTAPPVLPPIKKLRAARPDCFPILWFAQRSDLLQYCGHAARAVSLGAGIIMLMLFATELQYFLTTEVQPELFVDTSRNEKMRINVDVVFSQMPCVYMSIDVMDVSGETQLDVEHNLYKRRLAPDGRAIDETKHEILGDNHTEVELDPERCESCYGAESAEAKCCNTCAEVRAAYQKKGWAFTDPKGIVQCEREGYTNDMEEQKGEGCNLYGFLEVAKVSGNFHFAPGKSFSQHNVHIHDLQG